MWTVRLIIASIKELLCMPKAPKVVATLVLFEGLMVALNLVMLDFHAGFSDTVSCHDVSFIGNNTTRVKKTPLGLQSCDFARTSSPNKVCEM